VARAGAVVLVRPGDIVAERMGGLKRPGRVAQELAGEHDRVGGAVDQDPVCLRGRCDQSDGGHRKPGALADGARERDLVARLDLDPRAGNQPAARDVDEVDSVNDQPARQVDG
jgi:hypothetical protein